MGVAESGMNVRNYNPHRAQANRHSMSDLYATRRAKRMRLPASTKDWPLIWKELHAERSAIMEIEGRMPRDRAEKEAEQDIRKLAERG